MKIMLVEEYNMFNNEIIMSIFLITMVLLYVCLFIVQVRKIIKLKSLRNGYVVGIIVFSCIVFILGIITPISFIYAICLSNFCLALLEILELYKKRSL